MGVMGRCAMSCPILWAAIPGVWLEGNSTWHVQPHVAAQDPNPTGPHTLGELGCPCHSLLSAKLLHCLPQLSGLNSNLGVSDLAFPQPLW